MEAREIIWRQIPNCKNFKTPVTISEAVSEIGGDYVVEKQHLIKVNSDIFGKIANGENVTFTPSVNDIIKTHVATARTDTNDTLGIVGSGYGVVQNSKAFEFIDIITSGKIGGDKPVIETAGILDGGSRVYVVAKMPNDILIDNDNIEDYILFTNSHDGRYAVNIMFTPVRVICQNMLSAAFRESTNRMAFKHTQNVNMRLDWENQDNMKKAVSVLDMHKRFKDDFIQSLYSLNVPLGNTKNDLVAFAANVFASPSAAKLIALNNYQYDNIDEISTTAKNKMARLINTIESGVGQEQYKGTKLWLFNGLTSFYANEEKIKDATKYMDSLTDGNIYKKVDKGYQWLMAA